MQRYTIIPALTWEGYIALEALEGAADAEVFETFLQEYVVCLTYVVIDWNRRSCDNGNSYHR